MITFKKRIEHFGPTHAAIFKALRKHWGASVKMAHYWALLYSTRQLQGISPTSAYHIVRVHNIFEHDFEKVDFYTVSVRYERSYS